MVSFGCWRLLVVVAVVLRRSWWWLVKGNCVSIILEYLSNSKYPVNHVVVNCQRTSTFALNKTNVYHLHLRRAVLHQPTLLGSQN